MQQVGAADNAHERLFVQDRHPLNVMFFEQLRDFRQRGVWVHRHNVATHHVTGHTAMGLDVVSLHFRIREVREPPRWRTIRPGVFVTNEVSLAHDT